MTIRRDLLARAEAHVLRLAVTYALLDGSPAVARPHVNAAWFVWKYCRASVVHVYGEEDAITGIPAADRVLRALDAAQGRKLTQTAISRNVFGGNCKADQIERVMSVLQQQGRVAREEVRKTGGRPAVLWRLTSFVRSAGTEEG